MNNMKWFYDEESGRYVVRGARILFPNFEGAEQDYNLKGKRNFRLLLNKELADEMRSRGVYVREREGQNEDDDIQYMTKISVYRDADIRMLSGKAMTQIGINNDDPDTDGGALVDREFRKGHIKNGEIMLEFHISKNTRVANSSPYARVDTVILPIRKSRLLEDFDDMDFNDPFPED